MTDDPHDGEPITLDDIAAKYTDRPAELVAELRGRILDDIAEGLRLIGIEGGLVDMLEYAASLAHDKVNQGDS